MCEAEAFTMQQLPICLCLLIIKEMHDKVRPPLVLSGQLRIQDTTNQTFYSAPVILTVYNMSVLRNIGVAFLRVVSLLGILYLMVNLVIAFFGKVLPEFIFGPDGNSSDVLLDSEL